MTDDFAVLVRLNAKIGAAETKGDRKFLEGALAPELAFRRAGGDFVDRDAYLCKVARSEPRDLDIESIQIHGNRAVVACIVTVHRANGERARFHNLRLFTRTESGWKLLGWANEPVPAEPQATKRVGKRRSRPQQARARNRAGAKQANSRAQTPPSRRSM